MSQTIHLADYQPFTHLIEGVELTFRLSPSATRVLSRIRFRRNPASAGGDLFLHGDALKLIGAAIDGTPVSPALTGKGLTLPAADLPEAFVWEAEVEIDPLANTALDGLYISGGMFCTQCEAEGFRRITYYPDRPDVMATFSVRIESDLPVLLSNGNPGASGPGWAEWHDPWPKPAYLFALVAGDLVAVPDSFVTRSGRKVALNIWVRRGDEHKCDYAMDSLKRAMKWDEDAYGREYDLDIFNIVAVDDFNMGAMENKGLNIFNAALVLASPQTATDADYERIEGVIAHEYFHNWTGNRITCRDWFQLSLKEGLTVFRDQQFSADMRSAAVVRIQAVNDLRARQFREDAGPLAHPVRPESFAEINNFYTSTVYEKGAEVIGMLRTLVGPESYARALDLYFERHDGEATTIEAWLKVFEDATGRDLSQFKLWYQQAGTPRLTITDDFRDGRYTLSIKQQIPPTPGQPDKQPMVIPVALGLLGPNGDEVVPTQVLELTHAEQSFAFDGLGARPIPSILRGFSAPVIVRRESTREERAFLLANDTDDFARFEAGRSLARDVLVAMIREDAPADPVYLDALAAVVGDAGVDPAFRALVMSLQSEDDIAQALFDGGQVPDPDRIHAAREALLQAMAIRLRPLLAKILAAMAAAGPFSPDADAAAQRSLFTAALALQTRLDGGKAALAAHDAADNLTVELAAFAALMKTPHRDAVNDRFAARWSADRQVMDKWIMLQSATARPEAALDIARALETHPAFNARNPNRMRALINGIVTGNVAAFHRADGAAYGWLADWVLRVDAANPQLAARMITFFQTWRRYDADRQGLIRQELRRIAAAPALSGNTIEMVTRILGD